ncbi:hypothetical protein BJY00DRAFT_308846 [Aspergillus carlsbadensis]|nr:hypothetical protein BJY00DRAFT_308846 [Aspergillus carlsbadensis]
MHDWGHEDGVKILQDLVPAPKMGVLAGPVERDHVHSLNLLVICDLIKQNALLVAACVRTLRPFFRRVLESSKGSAKSHLHPRVRPLRLRIQAEWEPDTCGIEAEAVGVGDPAR